MVLRRGENTGLTTSQRRGYLYWLGRWGPLSFLFNSGSADGQWRGFYKR